MNAAIGFTAIRDGGERMRADADQAHRRALRYFPDLKQHDIQIGSTTLTLWGRGDLSGCLRRMPDGSRLALIGSPTGKTSWQEVEESLARASSPAAFRLPWDGRTILLKIDPNGETWTIWNDWLGSIPVFYAASPKCSIASTLEPAVVAAEQYTADDFFLPALVALIIHGNMLGDWTLFREMKTIPPDAETIIGAGGARSAPLHTIRAAVDLETGWDELLERMYSLSKQAILSALDAQGPWIIPLSSGLDSRLIAAVGAEAGVGSLRAYSWGRKGSQEVLLSRSIARALDLPWKAIDLGDGYLREHTTQWADLFGSAMHFHGMYQFPFLNALKAEPPGRIVSGFLGDTLCGYDMQFQAKYHQPEKQTPYMLPPNWVFTKVEEARRLFGQPIDEAVAQLTAEIDRLRNAEPGPWFQRLRYMTIWGRQSHFTYFQSMLCDYWQGVATPFLNREYARFCVSLPRPLLDERRLLVDMMRTYHPKVMGIPGSYSQEPAILTGSYLIKRRLANALPAEIRRQFFPETIHTRNYESDLVAFKKHRKEAIWPIAETAQQMAELFNMDELNKTYAAASEGDIRALRRLQCVQAVAYRMRKHGAEGEPNDVQSFSQPPRSNHPKVV